MLGIMVLTITTCLQHFFLFHAADRKKHLVITVALLLNNRMENWILYLERIFNFGLANHLLIFQPALYRML